MKNWINRYYQKTLLKTLVPQKVHIIYGPRRTGKTSLIQKALTEFKGKHYLGTGDDKTLRDILESENVRRIISAFAGYDLVIIDEAQRIHNIGNGLKILADHLPNLKIIATGSSSFDLASKVGEPLTGRHKTSVLFPISMLELKNQFGGMHIHERLEEFLVYGTYPEVLTMNSNQDRKEYLSLLRDSYLFKDILELESVKNSDKLHDLLKLLAFQVGSLVSLTELSKSLGMAKQTVERYLDLLEKSFVIKKVTGFSRNLRKEITKMSRYYFFDNGIMNAVTKNFNELSYRNDHGMMWENFIFIERMKRQSYRKIIQDIYFWRTYDQKEIDLIEERDGHLRGYEFKWGEKKSKPPKAWLENYQNASYNIVNRENFLEFIS